MNLVILLDADCVLPVLEKVKKDTKERTVIIVPEIMATNWVELPI